METIESKNRNAETSPKTAPKTTSSFGLRFSYVFLYVEASMQCNKKRITRRAGSKWKLSNCWLYKTYIIIRNQINMKYDEKVHHTLWALSFFFFLIVLPWFGHVFSNKGRFGHKRKLPGFFYFHIVEISPISPTPHSPTPPNACPCTSPTTVTGVGTGLTLHSLAKTTRRRWSRWRGWKIGVVYQTFLDLPFELGQTS